MSIKKLALAGGAAAMLMASAAHASVIDRPFFQVLGVVVVWGGTSANQNDTAAPVVSDFVLLTPATGTAGADLIEPNDVHAVVTGTLSPINGATGTPAGGGILTDNGPAGILDATDTLTAFGIDDNTDVSGLLGDYTSSFYVASNAAFDIHAVSTAATTTGDFTSMDENDISFALAVATDGSGDPETGTQGGVTYGTAAQDPSVGGTPVTGLVDLGDIQTETKVFDGGQRTAATTGNLAAQSVRFDATYGLAGGYDLSMGTGSISADVTYTIFVP